MSSPRDPEGALRVMTLAQVRRRRAWATLGFWAGICLLLCIFASLIIALLLLPVIALLCARSPLFSPMFFGVIAVLAVMSVSLGPWLSRVERRLLRLRELRQRERLLVRKLSHKMPLKGTLCMSAPQSRGALMIMSAQSAQGSLTMCSVSEP